MSINPDLSASILSLDTNLHNLVSDIDILTAVSPLNYKEEKEAFFQSNGRRSPVFKYREHNLNLFQQKRSLYNLPVDDIKDADVAELYIDVIESYTDKLDQFKSVGSREFLYDSLRYYGKPTDKDLGNARFILHLPNTLDENDDELLNAEAIVARFQSFANQHGYNYSLQVSDSMIANALVSGTTVKVNKSAMIGETEVNALAHHELGVHLVTTLNGRAQPLKILSMGSPVNTTTQEGLAILCEYLAGYLTLPRLKILALRVLAVHSMLQDGAFKHTFQLLRDQYDVEDNLAFTITARVYRGGGFTKDYLYLKGLHQILNAYETRAEFTNLLCGKVSLAQLDLVTKLIDKGYLIKPKFISPAIANPAELEPVHQFITHAIK